MGFNDIGEPENVKDVYDTITRRNDIKDRIRRGMNVRNYSEALAEVDDGAPQEPGVVEKFLQGEAIMRYIAKRFSQS